MAALLRLSPLIGPLVLLSQILFVIHAVKSGRNEWIYILLLFPGAGSLLYFFIELLPDIRHGSLQHTVDEILDAVVPSRKLKRLIRRVAEADTVANHQALAEHYLSLRQWDQAERAYGPCLTGLFGDDPVILAGLAEAQLGNDKPDAAWVTLEKLEKAGSVGDVGRRHSLRGRILEQKGDLASAEVWHRKALANARGEEAAYRFGMFLIRARRPTEAEAVFRGILARAKSNGKLYRRLEHAWIRLARQGLSAL
jgi:hypothetical protein